MRFTETAGAGGERVFMAAIRGLCLMFGTLADDGRIEPPPRRAAQRRRAGRRVLRSPPSARSPDHGNVCLEPDRHHRPGHHGQPARGPAGRARRAGGDRAALAALAPCFAVWGPEPVHFGELGSATTAKLALNLLVGLMAEGFSEALQLLRRAGLSEAGFVAVLERSGLRSPLYQRLWQRYSERDREVRFALDNLRKDVVLCQSHAAWAGAPPALLRALAALLGELPAELTRRDYSALVAKA